MKSKNNRYKYILWDHDGVLVDTERWYFAATQRALSELGVVFDEQQYLNLNGKGKSGWDLAKELGASALEIEAKRMERNNYYQHFLQTENIEIDGVLPVLEELSQKYRMGIVTTARRVDFELIHRDREIKNYMDFVLTVEDYERAKPHPAPYLAGLEWFNASAREAVAVEDTSRGLKSAAAAKVDCIVIATQFTRSQDFSLARQIINSIDELPTVLETIEREG